MKVHFTVKYRVDEKYKIANVSCWIKADEQDMLPDLFVNDGITILNRPLNKSWGTWIEGYRNCDYSISVPLSISWVCLESMAKLLIEFELTKLREVYRSNLEIAQTKPEDYTYELEIE